MRIRWSPRPVPTPRPGPEHVPKAPSPADAGEPRPPALGHLTLIGTGHVFNLDAAVRDAVVALRPDLVMLELDKARLEAILERRRTGKELRAPTAMARILQDFQRAVADMYGAQAGGEMLAGFDGAQMVGSRVAVIDRPIEETVRRLQQGVTWRERLRVVGFLAASQAARLWPFGRRVRKEQIEAQMAQYQEDPEAVFREMRQKLPSVYRVVLEERNQVLADNIRIGLAGSRRAVAILGDAHLPGVLERLQGLEMTVYRLGDVRSGRLPKPLVARSAPGETGKVSFSLTYDA